MQEDLRVVFESRNRQSLAAVLSFETDAGRWRLARADLTPGRLDGGGEPRAVAGAGAEQIFEVVAGSDATVGIDIPTDAERVVLVLD